MPAYASTFVRGADISWSTQLQTLGYSWEDQNQVSRSALQILKNHGVNLIRIRTFVNPTISPGSLGVGNMNQAGSIALAQAASAMGFQIMIDFHYSDTWADPGHQTIPAAWSSYNYAEMETAVYNYTYNFMKALAAAGVYPQYVQVGNEISNGMLWPIGEATVNPSQLAGLINNGYKAVKAVSSSTKVVIHAANLSNLSDIEWILDLIKSYGGTWDVSGFSYYDGPGTLSTITSNLATLASRYGKPVMICEIGHTESDYMGSADDVKTAIEAVQSVPGSMGLGVIYWEPDAPDDATTSNYSMGAVSEPSSKLLQFTPTIDQFLFTGSASGSDLTVNLPVASSWTEVQISNISISEGEAYVGFTVNAKAGNWVNVEKVQFELQ
jgi:arabinogalactan endo-1,4-beta-galactosidase